MFPRLSSSSARIGRTASPGQGRATRTEGRLAPAGRTPARAYCLGRTGLTSYLSARRVVPTDGRIRLDPAQPRRFGDLGPPDLQPARRDAFEPGRTVECGTPVDRPD